MFKRMTIVLASALIACMAFVACDKKADQPAQPAVDAAAPAADANANADQPLPPPPAAPNGQLPPGAPNGQLPPPPGENGQLPPPPPMPGGFPPPGEMEKPLPPVPPEAQAAVDGLVDVMQAIADSAKKDDCAEVLAELNKLKTDESIKNKLEASKVLEKYDKPVQEAINRANQAKMFNLAVQMAAFSKCQDKPEREGIDEAIKSILAPIDPDAEEPAAAEPSAQAPTPDPAPAAN